MHKGGFQSIRVSTRPDSLDHGRLKLMRDFGVRTVELGVQSMNNRVLSLSKRGHTAKETEGAVHRLRAGGFRVGIQLMPGLPGDTAECFRATIEKVLRLRPDMVRLYPTLVIRGTELADWYRMKTYRPLALEEAVEICAESCIRLEADGIPVIRIGVMSSPSLLMPGQILGGPWHPALGFLVRAAVYRKKIGPHLPYVGGSSKLRIGVPEREIPLFRGYRNQGLRWVETHTGAKIVSVRSDASLPAGQIRIDRL
jgi:histone acetyltransferase (RNA polymerase elongator complex component)